MNPALFAWELMVRCEEVASSSGKLEAWMLGTKTIGSDETPAKIVQQLVRFQDIVMYTVYCICTCNLYDIYI